MRGLDQWRTRGDAEQYGHVATEPQHYLASHGMDAEPVYVMPSNPISQACIDGRCLQVYHIKQNNIASPTEMKMADFLRNEALQIDPVESGTTHPPGRVHLSTGWRLPAPQFSWVDTSVGTVKSALGKIGELVYG